MHMMIRHSLRASLVQVLSSYSPWISRQPDTQQRCVPLTTCQAGGGLGVESCMLGCYSARRHDSGDQHVPVHYAHSVFANCFAKSFPLQSLGVTQPGSICPPFTQPGSHKLSIDKHQARHPHTFKAAHSYTLLPHTDHISLHLRALAGWQGGTVSATTPLQTPHVQL
jgi:hypothetical protein